MTQTLVTLINSWITLVRDGSIKDIEVKSIEQDESGGYRVHVIVYNHDDLVHTGSTYAKSLEEKRSISFS